MNLDVYDIVCVCVFFVGDECQVMIESPGCQRASWFPWNTVKCVKRSPRTVVATAVFVVLLILYFSPGDEPVYGPCQLILPDESHSGASNVTFGNLVLDFGHEINLRLFQPNSPSRVKLSAVIGRTLLPHAPYRLTTEPNQLRLIFLGSGVRLSVSRPYDECYRIIWESCSGRLRDSIRLSGAHWYGGPTVYRPRWPVSELDRPGKEALVTGDVYKDHYGGVVERFWISSEGAVIYVDYDVPLFISMNGNSDGNMDFEARFVRCL